MKRKKMKKNLFLKNGSYQCGGRLNLKEVKFWTLISGDEMVGWHHGLNGHEFGQIVGVGDGQGSLACCSPWSCKEFYTTERLN